MARPPRSYSVDLGPAPLSLICELMSSVNRPTDVGNKAAIQKKIAEGLKSYLLEASIARYNKDVLGELHHKAQASVDKKIYEEETERAITKFSESAKKIEKAVKEWEGEVNDKEHNVGKESRKRKLEEIEDHAEDLKKLMKIMSDK
jgi:hypothetical protein